MSIRTRETYLTSDGQEFTERAKAGEHEKELDRLAERARLSWLDRREYDLKYRLEELRRKDADRRRELQKTTAEIARFAGSTDGADTDAFREWQQVAFDVSILCADIAYGLEDIQETETLLDRFAADRKQLAEESKDADGTCQYNPWFPGPERCGSPSVEGTCWCKDHIDSWCEKHGRHNVGRAATGGFEGCAQCWSR